MNAPKVYLAGPVQGKSYYEASAWREELSKLLAPEIIGVSPLRYKEELVGDYHLGDEDYLLMGPDPNPILLPRGVYARDKADVMSCNLLFVRLDPHDVYAKLTTGTAIEMGWANAKNIPIVLMCNGVMDIKHPFVQNMIDFRTDTIEGSAEVIKAVLLP